MPVLTSEDVIDKHIIGLISKDELCNILSCTPNKIKYLFRRMSFKVEGTIWLRNYGYIPRDRNPFWEHIFERLQKHTIAEVAEQLEITYSMLEHILQRAGLVHSSKARWEKIKKSFQSKYGVSKVTDIPGVMDKILATRKVSSP